MAKAKTHPTAKAAHPMAHPLYLTADERKLFDALPAKLKEGWEVKEEEGKYEDTDKKRMLRMAFLRVEDPKLKEFKAKAATAKSPEELLKFSQTINLAKVPSGDLSELFFALGPEGLLIFIRNSLSNAKIDQDLDGIAFLSAVRNEFYKSSHTVS